MGMFNNKKGIFFTILAIVIISLFALSYSFTSNRGQRESTQKRIETLNNFIFSIEEDMSRNLFVSGFRTIFIVEKDILDNHNFVSNFTETFQETFFNGTYEQIHQNLMDGANFSSMVNNLNNSANKVNAIVSLSDASVYVMQDDPWNVKFVMKARLIVKDESNLVGWDKDEEIYAYVPTKYFDDPIYIINTNGLYSNKVRESPYKVFYSGSYPGGSYQNLSEHVINSYYVNNTDAPSFIDRLEGKFTNDNVNGVESIINLITLYKYMQTINPSYILLNKSNIDHIYFNSSQNTLWCEVHPFGSSSTRLDSSHITRYDNIPCYP